MTGSVGRMLQRQGGSVEFVALRTVTCDPDSAHLDYFAKRALATMFLIRVSADRMFAKRPTPVPA